MTLTLAINLTNPIFEDSDGDMFAGYSKAGRELSNCLHNVVNFVKSKFNNTNEYGLKSNETNIHEVLTSSVDSKLVLSIQLRENKADVCVYDSALQLTKCEIIASFDSFVGCTENKELRALAEEYRVFLESLTRGTCYGTITESAHELVMDIKKIGLNGKSIEVLFELGD